MSILKPIRFNEDEIQTRNPANGNVTIDGDLTISGDTTQVGTLSTQETTIVLNSDEVGSPSEDCSFEVERGTSTNATVKWDETSDSWKAGLKGAEVEIVDLSSGQTLTNKTLTTPVISSISNTGTITLPTDTDTLVGRATTDTLTNKSIDSDNNTITNIVNADIKAAAAIDATKIADGTVTSAEFQYIGGLTSDAQTQINAQCTDTKANEIDTNCNDIITTVGVAENAQHMGTYTGSTITSNQTAKQNIQELETSLETMATSSVVSEIDTNCNDIITTVGVAENAQHMGTYTGSTITSNQTAKQNIQELETSLETKQASDASLTSISGLTYVSDSFIKLSAEDTYTVRTLSETKTDLSLNNVDNTSDANKPVSTAQQTAIDLQCTDTKANEIDTNCNDIITTVGVSENDQHMGTYTGSTITSNQTAKQNLQELETSLELKAPIDAPSFTTSLTAAGDVTVSTGDIVLGTTAKGIRANTSDGSDTYYLYFGGGGAINNTRGGVVVVYGNEHGSTGSVVLEAGNVTGGEVRMKTNGANSLVVGKDQNITASAGFVLKSTTAGITAGTTQSQGQQPLTKEYNEVSTCANDNDVVTLPAAAAGKNCVIFNSGANTLQIFPASGDDLGEGANTSTTLATTETAVYKAYDATNWKKSNASSSSGSVIAIGQYSLSGDQTTNLSAGNEIEFDTEDYKSTGADFSFNSGTHQLTLKSGNEYVITGDIMALFSTTNGSFRYQIYNITDSGSIGTSTLGYNVNVDANANGHTTFSLTYMPDNNDVLELRIGTNTNCNSVKGTVYSYLRVLEIQH